MNDEQSAPRQYLGVMVSSTFSDLEEHRAALIKAIEGEAMYPVAMEHDAARPGVTVIESSLRKVREASAYIGVISHKYGQIPDSAEQNPGGFSLTELEFREARRLGRPMLIFIMGKDHRVKPADVERDEQKEIKLAAFREEVKRVSEESPIERVYYEFNSLYEFELTAVRSVAELRRFLDLLDVGDSADLPDEADDFPRPPALYAEPSFVGSHAFVGRAAELGTLSRWAAPADPRVHDLERRALLQYDQQAKRYDLHPVVRGFAAGSLGTEDRDRYGQRAVDYFSQRSRDPYERAETLDDVGNALQLVHALLQIGRSQDALVVFRDGLIDALFFNLEESPEVVSLLRPFFDPDWTSPLASLSDLDASYVVGDAAFAFYNLGELEQSLAIHEVAVRIDLEIRNWPGLQASLARMARIFAEQNRLASQNACVKLELEVAELTTDAGDWFRSRYDRFEQLVELGQWEDAEYIWRRLNRMEGNWRRTVYRPGMAEAVYALLQFHQGSLTEEKLADAERVAQSGLNRPSVRALYALRGEWHLERREYAPAVESLHEAIRMTREAHLDDAHLEARLALARFRLGHLPDARPEAIRLSSRGGPAQLALAELWDAIGDAERAVWHAEAAYRWALADGEPFVHRYQLDRARILLKRLGKEIPAPAAFNPDREHELLPRSALKIRRVIARLRGD